MNTRKIKAINRKAEKEAQKAVDKIYKKYNKEIVKEISRQIPKGMVLNNCNGMSWITDGKGNEISHGKAWGKSGNEQLETISLLQYSDNIAGCFLIPDTIKGTK